MTDDFRRGTLTKPSLRKTTTEMQFLMEPSKVQLKIVSETLS